MQAIEIPTYRIIKVSFKFYRGDMCIKFWEDLPQYGEVEKPVKIIPYDYHVDDTLQQAINVLVANGFNIVGRGTEHKYYVLICKNWGEDFIKIRDIK